MSSSATPAFQVNVRNRNAAGVRAVDHNRLAALSSNSMTALGENSVSSLSQKGGATSSQQQQQQPTPPNAAASFRTVPNPPTVLTLASVRRLLCEVTSGGAFPIENISVATDNACNNNNNNIGANNGNRNTTTTMMTASNARRSDLTVGQLIEGCEPGLRCALEMCWLRCGRDTRRFVTEVQSSSEAALLLRGRIHFGFEVGVDTLVAHLAPTLAVRLEMLPSTVFGIHHTQHQQQQQQQQQYQTSSMSPQQHSMGATPAAAVTTPSATVTAGSNSNGKMLTSNGASPVNNNPEGVIPPPPPPAPAAAKKTVGGDDEDDDNTNQNNTSVTSAGTSASSTSSSGGSGGSSGNNSRAALRRQRGPEQQQQQQQRQQQQQQQREQPLDRHSDGAAMLFSPLKGNINGVNNNNNVVVGSACIPIGISRAVEDKIWLDTADLFCDALSLIGDTNRNVMMGIIVQSIANSPVMCETHMSMVTAATTTSKNNNSGNALSSAGVTPLQRTGSAVQPLSRKTSMNLNNNNNNSNNKFSEIPEVLDEDSCGGMASEADDKSTHNNNNNNNSGKIMSETPGASPFANTTTNTSSNSAAGTHSVLQADTATALAARSSLARSSGSSSSLSAMASAQQQLLCDAATISPDLELRRLFKRALSVVEPLRAEAARLALIAVLRAVSVGGSNNSHNNHNNNAASSPNQPREQQYQNWSMMMSAENEQNNNNNNNNNHMAVLQPRWTEGMPHNHGSAAFIRELLASEQRTPYSDYFATGMQPNLTPNMRTVLVDWLHAICTRLRMSDATFHLNVALLDRALTLERDVGTRQLQLLGIAGMVIASKYCEIAPPPVSSFVHMSANHYLSEDILATERLLFSLLDAHVTMPSTLEAADLILAEQDPPATNEQRAYVHFLLHAHLHFYIYGGQGRVIEAARAAVFLSRVELEGLELQMEKMVAQRHQQQQQQQQQQHTAAAAATTTKTSDGVASMMGTGGAGGGATSSAAISGTGGGATTGVAAIQRRASFTQSALAAAAAAANGTSNRGSSHLPYWHVDSCFLSPSESRVAHEIIQSVVSLRDPTLKANDLLVRYAQPRHFSVAQRFMRRVPILTLRERAIEAASRGTKFQALHTPRTPNSSTGSSPASASRSLRGD